MGVLQRDLMPELCFVMVLTSCKDFFADCKDFIHDLTDMSCPRLHLWFGRKSITYSLGIIIIIK